MPISARDLSQDSFVRILLMGPPKVGKTSCVVSTLPGPVRVLLCEDKSALKGAQRRTDNFDVELVSGWNQMTKYVVEAKEDVKAGRIKSVVVDPLSTFGTYLFRECAAATKTADGKEDGRRAYPMCTDRLVHLVELLFTIPGHLVVISHHQDLGGEPIGDGLEKSGEGIVPLLPGKARGKIASMFVDVVWMEKAPVTTAVAQRGERIFVTNPNGAWGPGCRSLEGSEVLKADMGVLLKAFADQAKLDADRFNPRTNNRPPTRPITSKPIIRKPTAAT